MTNLVRLNKHIAQLGICSRRKADNLIAAGKVKVNGEIVTEMGLKVDPNKDTVTVLPLEKGELEGVTLQNQQSKISNQQLLYVALNKPVDVISSASNEQGTSVVDLITPENYLIQKDKDGAAKKLAGARLYPVGRLDKDSEGLVLMTNDGELTNRLTHPSFEHEKEYEVTIDASLSPDAKKVLTKGMVIDDDEFVQGLKIKHEHNLGKRSVITVVLKEGKNRQIRRMFGRLGYTVVALKRTRIANLTLRNIPTGRWVFVQKRNIIN